MLKVFFDVDGVLIDGWHNDPKRRKAWDAAIKADLGIDRARIPESPVQHCGRRDDLTDG